MNRKLFSQRSSLAVFIACALLITATTAGAEGKYTPGEWVGTAQGFGGPVTVTVTCDSRAITKVTADGPKETNGVGSRAIEQLPSKILEAQSADIDGISGASFSSKAVLSAAKAAISKATAKKTISSKKVTMKSGTYTASAYGFNPVGQLTVAVTVDPTSIKRIEVTDRGPDDEPMVNSVVDLMIPRMVKYQSLTIDAITGASASSNAVKAAASDAVVQALKAGGSDPAAIAAFDRKMPLVGGKKTISVDVLVVGMGGSGCSAAMSSAEAQVKAGRKVSVLAIDKTGKFGGTSAFCGEPMAVNAPRFKQELNGGKDFMDGDALYTAWLKYTEGDEKKEIVKKFLDNSGDTIDWLYYDHGFILNRPLTGFSPTDVYRCKYQYVYNGNIESDREYSVPKDKILPMHQMVDSYFKKLIGDYVKLGGRYMLETEARSLIVDKTTKAITGVKAVDVYGTEYTINAKSVILATGGFAGNAKMEEKYFSDKYYPLKGGWDMIGMRQNDGKMIQSAIDAGAGTYNIGMPPMVHFATSNIVIHDYPVNTNPNGKIDWWYGWKTKWSLNDVPNSMVLVNTAPWVGMDGKRFVKEGQLFSWWMAGPNYYSIWSQALIDDVAKNGFMTPVSTYSRGQGGVPAKMPIPEITSIVDKLVANGSILKANSLEELAARMGVPADNLVGTIREYDAFCAKGVDEKFGKDPAALRALGDGPYYAVKGYSTCFSTCGGLDINASFNVLSADSHTPIKGLYAVGNDSMGVLYSEKKPYVTFGGAALGWAFTSGRLAGPIAVSAALGR